MPRSRSPWGYTGSPGTVDNIVRSSPGVGRAFGRSYPSHSPSSDGQWGKENASPSGDGSAADVDNRDHFAYATPSFDPGAAPPPVSSSPHRAGDAGGAAAAAEGRAGVTSPSPGAEYVGLRRQHPTSRRKTAAAAIYFATSSSPGYGTRVHVSPAEAARAAATRVKRRELATLAGAQGETAGGHHPHNPRSRLAGASASAHRLSSTAAAAGAGAPTSSRRRPAASVRPYASFSDDGASPTTTAPAQHRQAAARNFYGGSRSGGGGRGGARRTSDAGPDAAKVERLSEEVVVLKRMVHDQGRLVSGELEGMKQQMSQMFEMMQRVLAASGPTHQPQPPPSPPWMGG